MAAVHVDIHRGFRRARFAATIWLFVVGAIGLARCGGASKTSSTQQTTLASQSPPPATSQQTPTQAATSAATTTTPAHGPKNRTATTATTAATGSTNQAASQTSTAAAPTRATKKPIHPTTKHATTTRTTTPNTTPPSWVTTTGNAQTTTIPAIPGSPTYVGPSPLMCLELAGLNRGRPATEPEVWEANDGSSSENDRRAIVFLSGPYQNDASAESYANSLTVAELATSGGRWVASAALTSGLGSTVDRVARCMAGG
jgi:hypothetical protein